MKLSEAVPTYLAHCRVEKLNSPETLIKVRDCFNSWIEPVLGKKELEELTRLHILELKGAMFAKDLSVYRQYSIIIALKTFLKFCAEALKVKTLDPAEVKLPDRGKPNVIVLTNDEIQKLLENLEVHTYSGLRLKALFELLLGTGMRISEALSLDRVIFDKGETQAEVIGKGKKKRTIFLTFRAIFSVQQYLKTRSDMNEAAFVTTGDYPRRLSRSDISKYFKALRLRAGIKKKVTPHILRHTYCTNLLNNGADITFIKELAGHEDIHTTAKYYLGVDHVQLRKVVDKYLDYGLEQKEKPLTV